MNCQQTGTHTIKQGDSLYLIAQMHQMTVPELLELNPGINPYNLQIGEVITICRDSEMMHNHMNSNPSTENNIMILNNKMRLAWEQHVYWTRMLLISIVEKLSDQSAVTARLLQNPDDIAAIFAEFYPSDIANTIANLLTEHLQIGEMLITAWRDGDMKKANELNAQWYANANKMAMAFNSINPYYNLDELRNMLYNHLGLTTQEIAMRIARNYPADIEAFNQVEQEALNMADYFTNGLIQQFPMNF